MRFGLALLLALAGCDDQFDLVHVPDFVALDAGADAALGPWNTPVEIVAVNTIAEETDPSMTEDGRILMFASNRVVAADFDIYVAKRNSTSDPFGSATPVIELNTTMVSEFPFISADGRTVYFTRQNEGVFRASRTLPTDQFSGITRDFNLGPLSTDGNAEVSSKGTYAVVTRVSATDFSLYYATRGTPTEPWSALTELSEIDSAKRDSAGSVNSDATRIVFDSDREGLRQLYEATRDAVTDPFGPPRRLDELAEGQVANDPWLSPDARTIVFARGGNLYMATRW